MTGSGEHCYRLFESFDAELSSSWIQYGVRGTGRIVTQPRGRVAHLEVGPKERDEVAKASIIHEFPRPMRVGDVLEVAASFRLPEIRGGRVSLIDIECKYCGLATQAGIRLFVNPDRTIFLERAKLGMRSSFPQKARLRLPVDEWFDVRWRTRFGQGDDGQCRVWIDETLVIEASGPNFPDRTVASLHGIDLIAEQYDRVEIGLTANSQPRPMTLEMDDIEFLLDYAEGCDAHPL